LRKAIAGLLSLPVIGASYLLPVARRRAVLRMVAVLGVGALFTLVALSSSVTPTANAFKSAPVDTAALARISTSIVTGHGLSEPATVVFSEPVDTAKVMAALQVTPAAAVRLSWSPDATMLHVAPATHWAASTLYTLSLTTTAVGRDGTSLPSPLSAVFLTRAATTARATVEPSAGTAATTAPVVSLSFSSPVTAAAVAGALTITPAVVGKVSTVGPDQGAPDTTYQWQASEPLAPGASYHLTLASDLRDTDGAPLAAGVTVDLKVPALPAVVRIRPAAGSANVALAQTVSVRFSQPMELASTQAAFHISAYTSPAKQGRFSWAEGDTVLIWTPRAAFGYGSRYTVTIDGSARSAAGQPLAAEPTATVATATFSTLHRPAAKPRTVDKPKPTGGSSTSAPWLSTEKYFLSLINCDHTGGWVSSSGVCTGRGSNGRAPLALNAKISNGASRPWAKYLAQTTQLYHGCPSCRLSAIGFTNAWWGENLAWWSGSPTSGAIQAVLFFQSEKASLGGHYVNMMDSRGRSAGVGVWQANGRVVFAIDFWGG